MARLEEVANNPLALIAFYTTIAEISLPDIDHGYFIHPPGLVRDHIFEHGPVRVTENVTGIVCGSDVEASCSRSIAAGRSAGPPRRPGLTTSRCPPQVWSTCSSGVARLSRSTRLTEGSHPWLYRHRSSRLAISTTHA
jgi:hypothetical protein